MLAEIAAHAILACARLGKAALSRRVLDVIAKVPRHEFVPGELPPYAYANSPLPIGFGKTISQPFIVAVMTRLLDVRPSDSVLEIGTGLGCQAAILMGLAQRVFSVELIEELTEQARRRLARQCTKRRGQDRRWLRRGARIAPFDKVIVTAAPGGKDGDIGGSARQSATHLVRQGRQRLSIDPRDLRCAVLVA
jgi:protein-L-isoaspartate(D-aspartate) O-methyltransferase